MLALAVFICLLASSLALSEQQSKLMTRIVNGQPSELFSRPYQASLQTISSGEWYHVCGASIIDVDRLVTAAHCLIFPAETLRVQVGLLNLTAPPNEYQQTIAIKAYKVNEGYIPDIFQGVPNDIGLLYTKTPFSFNPNVQPVKLAPNGLTFDNTKCVISGWGKTSATSEYSRILREVAMPKIPLAECQGLYAPYGLYVRDTAICVFDGDNPPGQNPSACSGDSGGPMLCTHQTRQYLAGLTSFGLTTCEGWLPTVYTRIGPFNSWINKNKHAPKTQEQLMP